MTFADFLLYVLAGYTGGGLMLGTAALVDVVSRRRRLRRAKYHLAMRPRPELETTMIPPIVYQPTIERSRPAPTPMPGDPTLRRRK